MNRARPMAARLIKNKKKNKPRVKHEPRSAHGRAVKDPFRHDTVPLF